MADKKNWIQEMNMKKGALKKTLKVKEGNKIPAGKLAIKRNDSALTAKRKNLAKTLSSFK